MDVATAPGWVGVYGPFDLRDARGERPRVAARSAEAVIALLALRPRGATRETLASTLWPEGEPEAARAALRTALRRVRVALGDGALVEEGGRLRLALPTDSAEASRHRRDRRAAVDADAALAAAQAEWAIVDRELLEGWDDAWVEPLRDDARADAHECALALARLYEERNEGETALGVLDGVLAAVPHHAEALEHAMRLAHALHGREAALARVAEARRSLDPSLELPESIRRLERTIRRGVTGFVPPPTAFSDGAELALLGHMVEADLRRGGTSALATLAQGAFDPMPLRHPYRTLDLLRRAVELSTGYGPERTTVMTAAIQYALYVGDNEALHALCDELIAAFPATHRLHNGSLSVKGFAYLHAREFEPARTLLQRAADGCAEPDRRAVAEAMLGYADWAELRFEPALTRMGYGLQVLEGSTREDRDRNRASLYGELSLVHAARGDWDASVESGRAAQAFAVAAPPTAASYAAPLGLALVVQGETAEGIALLRHGLKETYRERMPFAHAVALDVSAFALERLGERSVAAAVLDASNAIRRRLGYPRSPGERRLAAEAVGLDPELAPTGPLRLQSPGALTEWTGEALERVGATVYAS